MIEFVHPEALGDKLGGLEIRDEGAGDQQVKEIIEKVVRFSAKTCSPYFYNQVRWKEWKEWKERKERKEWKERKIGIKAAICLLGCLLYTSPSPRDS